MAIEALKDLQIDYDGAQGTLLQSVKFSHPMTFPQGKDHVETQMVLSGGGSEQGYMRPDMKWSEFHLFVFEGSSYIECCSGWIRASNDVEDKNIILSNASYMEGLSASDWIRQISEACVTNSDQYTSSTGSAVRYGPSFQCLRRVRLGSTGEARFEVDTQAWKRFGVSKDVLPPSYAIHPATLDGLAQVVVPALTHRHGHMPTMMPVQIDTIYIDSQMGNSQSEFITAAAKCEVTGTRGAAAHVIGVTQGTHHAMVYLHGLQVSSIGRYTAVSSPASAALPRSLCKRLVWRPDIDTLTCTNTTRYCTQARPSQHPSSAEDHRRLILAIMCSIEEAIQFVDQNPSLVLQEHLKAYVSWMKYQQQKLRRGSMSVANSSVRQFLCNNASRISLIQHLESSGIDHAFFMTVSHHLIDVLRGTVDPLDLLFRDGLADKYYEHMLANSHHSYPAERYVELLAFKNPSMKIIEIGAGTGGQTLRLLEAMSSPDGSMSSWDTYDYTDISPAFFSQAQQKFENYSWKMRFRTCDISQDPVSQSFDVGSYDLAIASHVLHATDDVEKSLQHIRKIFKPEGKLLLFETTVPDAVPVGFAFGLLKGWWSPLDHQQRSPHSPCLSIQQWDQRLREAGFSGLDFEIPGQEDPECRYSSIMDSTSTRKSDDHSLKSATRNTSQTGVGLIIQRESEAQHRIAKSIKSRFEDFGWESSPEILSLAEAAERRMGERFVLAVLVEIDATFLDSISEPNFRLLQTALLKSHNIIWVTRSVAIEMEIDPRHHLAEGLGRTLMSEDASRKFSKLSLEPSCQEPLEAQADLILKVIKSAMQTPNAEQAEADYLAIGQELHIARVLENDEMNARVAQAIQPNTKKSVSLDQAQLSLHPTLFESPGTLEWRECTEVGIESDRDVTFQVRAFGLGNYHHDIDRLHLGDLAIGLEFAGIVRSAGARSGFQPGDHICAIGFGVARTSVTTTADAAIKFPPDMSFEEAASFPLNLSQSYHGLVNVARVQAGQKVLILQAGSSFGQTVIQAAQRLGADVMASVQTQEEWKHIRDVFNVPEGNIFCDSDASLLKKLFSATKDAGFDVIIGSLHPNSAASNVFLRHLAPLGTVINTRPRLVGGPSPRQLSTWDCVMPANTNFTTVDMMQILQTKPSVVYNSFQAAANLLFGINSRFMISYPLRAVGADAILQCLSNNYGEDATRKEVVSLKEHATVTVCNFSTTSITSSRLLTYFRPPSALFQDAKFLPMHHMSSQAV